MTTRCNCDASCGENRYHDVGDPGCRFSTQEEYDVYWEAKSAWWRNPPKPPAPYVSLKTATDEALAKLKEREKYKMGSSWDNYEPPSYDAPKKVSEITEAERPWGRWQVLDVDQGYKVKRLMILPDQAISLQYHNHRSEHWTIVQGEGKVIVDGNIFKVTKGESFHVPKQSIHKITNTHLNEMLIAIEVQMGEICSEDDIVRC